MDDGKLLVSMAKEGGILNIWRTDTWNLLTSVRKISTIYPEYVAVHPKISLIAVPAPKNEIKVWSVDFTFLKEKESINTVHYVNAKTVLVGDSGVGKSGLAIKISEGVFRPTESTHGAQFWHLPVKNVQGLPSNIQAELTLWDLAGQPEYRLVHQLFLDDTDAAMLLFDCSDPNEPFHGVPYWAKVLKKHSPQHSIKFLVSARSDVSPVTVDNQQINQKLAEYGLIKYFKTSAKNNEGVEELYNNLLQSIPWKKLPRTSTPELFQVIKDYLLEIKNKGKPLVLMSDIRRDVAREYKGGYITNKDIEAVVALLQVRGLVYRLKPRPNLSFILTRPELINQYTASIINETRNHPKGIGAVTERKVLIGDIPFSGFKRLSLKEEEKMVLEATVELLIRHDLCFREMGLLVFPSQINVSRPKSKSETPQTEVAYQFSGSIEMIYASLVVRLSHTDYFRLKTSGNTL